MTVSRLNALAAVALLVAGAQPAGSADEPLAMLRFSTTQVWDPSLRPSIDAFDGWITREEFERLSLPAFPANGSPGTAMSDHRGAVHNDFQAIEVDR